MVALWISGRNDRQGRASRNRNDDRVADRAIPLLVVRVELQEYQSLRDHHSPLLSISRSSASTIRSTRSSNRTRGFHPSTTSAFVASPRRTGGSVGRIS